MSNASYDKYLVTSYEHLPFDKNAGDLLRGFHPHLAADPAIKSVDLAELIGRRDALFALNDAHLIGYVSLQPIVEYEGIKYRQVSTLWVANPYSGAGLARELIRQIHNRAQIEAPMRTYAHIKDDAVDGASAFTRNGYVTSELPYEGRLRPALVHEPGIIEDPSTDHRTTPWH